MPRDRDEDLLGDIVAAARAARAFVDGMGYADFAGDPKTQSAVTYQLVVIGEAAKGLSPAVRSRHAEISWSEICRARDLFVHHYKKIDSEELWVAVSRDLSQLLEILGGSERK
jgi:uncharacterized protein with HEPN domain